MKVHLLGTGASDGIPAIFTDSRVNRYALDHGGKDRRTRCSALIDDHLKLDFGPDTWIQVVENKVDASEWTAVLMTHSHEDHLDRSEFQYFLYPFTEREFMPFPIYANQTVADKLWERYPEWPLEIVVTRSYCPFEHQGYTITPIKANHKLDEDSQNLIFQRDGVTFLYGTDTGYWQDETWEFLTDFSLDGLVIECTEGLHRTSYYGHMDLKECVELVQRLRSSGILRPDAQVVTTHHAHSGDLTHAELEEALRPYRMVPGFDGMAIEVVSVSGRQ